jgi:hypothetical protein
VWIKIFNRFSPAPLLQNVTQHCSHANSIFSFMFGGSDWWTIEMRHVKFYMEMGRKHVASPLLATAGQPALWLEVTPSLRSVVYSESADRRSARALHVPAISASGPECNRTVLKLVEQVRNFWKEYRFYKYWAAGSDPFHKGQVAWWDNLPPVAITPSLKKLRRSAATKIPLA